MLRGRPCALVAVLALCAAPRAALAQCPLWTDAFSSENGANLPVWALASFDLGDGPRVFAGGDFTTIGPSAGAHVASWNGTGWTTVGGGTNGPVLGFASFDDGDGLGVYAVGSFTDAGGVAVNNIARWDGTSWSDLAGGTNEAAVAVAVFDDGGGEDLYVGGLFIEVGAELPAVKIARWDGASWSAVGAGIAPAAVLAMAAFDDGAGDDLYVAGLFTTAGGLPAQNVARWDGTSWSPVGSGIDGQVDALTVFDDGSGPALYAGGFFTAAGGAPAVGIARWDGSAWGNVGGGVDGYLRDLTVHDDGSGPELIAVGQFATAGTKAANNVARWDGTQWSALGGGVGDAALTATSAVLGTPRLYLGGSFDFASGEPSLRLAEWLDPCAGTSVAFCFGTDAACPCGNGGAPDRGCEIAQTTGGVRLEPVAFRPDGTGGGTATFSGAGFPPSQRPTVVLIRSAQVATPPPVLGDGLLCVGPTVTRIQASAASGSASLHGVTHGAGGGDFFYQLWFRNQPASFCDPAAAFNLSNAYKLAW